MNLYDVILSPVVTEKSVNSQKINQYTFYVRPKTNKIEVQKAVAMLYGVKVKSVNINKLPEKKRLVRRGKETVKRPRRIKAIVQLQKGQSIDFSKIKDIKI